METLNNSFANVINYFSYLGELANLESVTTLLIALSILIFIGYILSEIYFLIPKVIKNCLKFFNARKDEILLLYSDKEEIKKYLKTKLTAKQYIEKDLNNLKKENKLKELKNIQ